MTLEELIEARVEAERAMGQRAPRAFTEANDLQGELEEALARLKRVLREFSEALNQPGGTRTREALQVEHVARELGLVS